MKIKRIKAYVRKSGKSCYICKYNVNRWCKKRKETHGVKECTDCELHTTGYCYCIKLADGEPCKHFEKAV